MLILADLGHDPEHWPSVAAIAADQLAGSGEAETPTPQESLSCEPS